MKSTLYLISLGCAKNQVDSEILLWRFQSSGWEITNDPKKAELIIINTCSFIESATEEAIDTILALAEHKKNGICKKIIVAGCLPQRFKEKLVKTLPEVDIFVGTGGFHKIVEIAEKNYKSASFFPDPNLSLFPASHEKRIKENNHTAYIKIAEGCDRKCTYCIIPKIKGKYQSRPFDDIIIEAETFAKEGIKELIFVAQETTCYGKDLNPPTSLKILLEDVSKRVSNISKEIGLRILYCHPKSISEALIKTIADTENIYPYFDIPIQHSSDSMLRKMGRDYTKIDLYRLFDQIKYNAPKAVFRTSIIVGFPDESVKDFEELSIFVKKSKFDHLGVFVYSDAEDIPSHKLTGHVDKKYADRRREVIMKIQSEISLKHNQKRKGEVYDILIEGKNEKGLYIGRAWFQAPEVDGVTYINTKNHKNNKVIVGTFIKVKITEALAYDLIGEPV